MKIYLAGSENYAKMLGEDNLYKGANVLNSFFYCTKDVENITIPQCKDFLLDSGAFTFLNSGKNVNWEDYTLSYADFIKRNKIKKYFELDIDKIIGFENVLKLRKLLEKETGIKPIPVWHKSRGLEQFKKDASEYPYVAVGGIVTREIKPNEYPILKVLIREAHRAGAKIHGLGFTKFKLLNQYHFDSVDSSSWTAGKRFGFAQVFDGKKLVKIQKPENSRGDYIKLCKFNFVEWKKMCDYAEKNFRKVRKPHEKINIKITNIFNINICSLLFNKQHFSIKTVSTAV